MTQTVQELRRFVIDSFLFGQEDGGLDNSDSFMEKGIIDSTGMAELVVFLEQKYKIKVADKELVPENLDSIDKLAKFIEKKTAQRI